MKHKEELSLAVRIYNLCQEEVKKMKPIYKGKYSNRVKLYNRVESIIYNDWGFLNGKVQDILEDCVIEIIPEEID